MRENRRELIFSLSVMDESVVNADDTARNGKRVNRWVVHDHKLQLPVP